MSTKQVIIIRADLKLRRGKECAQVAHAASMWLREYALYASGGELTPEERNWLSGNYRKIVLKGESAQQLRELQSEAERHGLKAYPVVDDGLTEVPAGTVTALAIGPHEESAFVGLTDHLPLY